MNATERIKEIEVNLKEIPDDYNPFYDWKFLLRALKVMREIATDLEFINAKIKEKPQCGSWAYETYNYRVDGEFNERMGKAE